MKKKFTFCLFALLFSLAAQAQPKKVSFKCPSNIAEMNSCIKNTPISKQEEAEQILYTLKEAELFTGEVNFFIPCENITAFQAVIDNEGNNCICFPPNVAAFTKLGNRDWIKVGSFLHAISHLKNNKKTEDATVQETAEWLKYLGANYNQAILHLYDDAKYIAIYKRVFECKADGIKEYTHNKQFFYLWKDCNKGELIRNLDCPTNGTKEYTGDKQFFYIWKDCNKEGPNQNPDWKDPNMAIDLVFIEGGTFTMGCTSEQKDCGSDEKPTHKVTLSDFYIGKYEVTQRQWREVMGTNPSYFENCDDCPVEKVSWDDVQDFLSKLNNKTDKKYRLPTEAEWEYAARGGNKTKNYIYAGSNALDDIAWYKDNSNQKTQSVGSRKPNELGLYDMSGNVYEWCSNWYEHYKNSPSNNPMGANSGSNRVLRGGSWYGYREYCRIANRGYDAPRFRDNTLGFRVALSQ